MAMSMLQETTLNGSRKEHPDVIETKRVQEKRWPATYEMAGQHPALCGEEMDADCPGRYERAWKRPMSRSGYLQAKEEEEECRVSAKLSCMQTYIHLLFFYLYAIKLVGNRFVGNNFYVQTGCQQTDADTVSKKFVG